MSFFEAVVIAIVEGITEFLPVSSTGHMVITQALLGMESDAFLRAYTVNIQFGAILSVVVIYWKSFFRSLDFYFRLFVACLPLVIAYLLEKQIDMMLASVWVVAVALLLGGIVLLYVDRWFAGGQEEKEGTITYRSAFIIGLFQIISVIPGVSRSAATIVGGMSRKLSRKTAAEFSFFLAVPTMFAASLLKLGGQYHTFTTQDIRLLLLGNLVSFLVAMLAIRTFIHYLTRHGFRAFGWYRIGLGVILLVLLLSGSKLDVL
ncbi:MAG TPA: undecaprenyl-diphosphate phosphatase [Bacteroidales bacterium]|nr:undecaprenyl-diphosphate phosphatase [Bacteroidales bacterium]HSA44523.1 undecaprenyl-diphosphate phosphatase [Bacteroidales bacterium]